mmetsp:Transcript_86733/g.168008  ORF Transcript_86733/g.168008 Transcript_86733/m.168008 type:complete len:323 (-) Transcript_86733:54-1022(-)
MTLALILRCLAVIVLMLCSVNVEASNATIIAFAANEGFQYKLVAVLERIRYMKKGRTGEYRLIGFDLGLKPAEAAALRCASPPLLDELRPFAFGDYPAHVATLGCYAWKPLLLHQLRRENPDAAIIWLDTAVGLVGPSPATVASDWVERAVLASRRQGGALSDRTARSLADLTHPGMFDFFEEKWGWTRQRFEQAGAANCNGAFSAWAPHQEVGAAVLKDWVSCALEKECVCPGGSNRGNHRQDQAALTLSMAMHGVFCHGPGKRLSPTSEPPSDPFKCHWVHTHASRPRCRNTTCVLKTHAPNCLPAYEASTHEMVVSSLR